MPSQFDSNRLYDIYNVTLKLRGKMYGGVPKDPEVIKAWVKARTGYDDEQTEVQTAEALDVAVDEKAEGMWTGFAHDERGLFIYDRNVKAMIRESATMLGITKKKVGSKQVVTHGLEVKCSDGGQRLYLDRKVPDGTDEGPIHVMTARGPRTALKRQDYVDGAVIKLSIWVLKTAAGEKRHVGESELVDMLTFAQENGLGASRSQCHGKFDVVEFAKVG